MSGRIQDGRNCLHSCEEGRERKHGKNNPAYRITLLWLLCEYSSYFGQDWIKSKGKNFCHDFKIWSTEVQGS